MTRVVHCRRESYDVYIGRPSKWGNPYILKPSKFGGVIVGSREEAISEYRAFLGRHPEIAADARRELKGKVLGCWCAPQPCHGDVLAEIADSDPDGPIRAESAHPLPPHYHKQRT